MLHRARVTTSVVGGMFIVAGVCFLVSQSSDLTSWWPWSVGLIAAGVSCLMFAWHIDSASWWWWSRTLAVIGLIARIGSVLELWTNGVLDAARAIGGISVLAISTVAVFNMWSSSLRYWSQRTALTHEHRPSG